MKIKFGLHSADIQAVLKSIIRLMVGQPGLIFPEVYRIFLQIPLFITIQEAMLFMSEQMRVFITETTHWLTGFHL